jgi:hypothetical protein
MLRAIGKYKNLLMNDIIWGDDRLIVMISIVKSDRLNLLIFWGFTTADLDLLQR